MAIVPPAIQVQNLDPVEGGVRVVISVPESRQPNLSLGVVSCNYHVFVPNKILSRLKDALSSSE